MLRSLVALVVLVPVASAADDPTTRSFKFTYEATVTGLKPGQPARVWVPVPQTSEDQEVLHVAMSLPGEPALNTETKFGNRMFYIAARADADGNLPVKATYTVRRREVKGET